MAATQPEIISHWYTLIDGLQKSPKEFYETLSVDIADRKIPKAKTSDVSFAEGGLLSGKRQYLRVKRGEHIFDICAAPFGRGFFVSWWLVVAESRLLSIPLLGLLFRLLKWLFKRPTYYSVDTALMFQSAVHGAVLGVIDDATTAKGLRALSETERKPIMKDFLSR